MQTEQIFLQNAGRVTEYLAGTETVIGQPHKSFSKELIFGRNDDKIECTVKMDKEV
jgi:hypothetical protein